MPRLTDLKKRVGNSAEATKAISELTEFTSIVTLGTTLSGGALTLPLILVQSGKASGALLSLTKVLLADSPEPSSNEREPADRADDIFYVFAQRSFLNALNRLDGKLPKNAKVDGRKHHKITEELELAVLRPDQAEAAFQFGWNPQSGPLQLFDSYKTWFTSLLISMGTEEQVARKWLDAVEKDARKGLFRELVSRKKDRTWMVHYQLLENTSTILDLLQGFRGVDSQPSDLAWQQYLNYLARKPSLPIWGEEAQGLGIEKLFVEASYSYARHLPSGSCLPGNPAQSVSLKAFITGLLSRRRPSNELVFIMGGPGTGKTSLMDVLCGELAESGSIPVVLIPAKRLDPRRALLPEIQNYLRDNGYASLAELITSTDDCVLAIDGFDELAHATLSTLETFFRGAQELIRERSGSRLRILLSGRPTLFSSNDVTIPAGSHVVTLEPFDRDRVDSWSINWRTATGGTFDGTVYLNSTSSDIRDLASQPMLLYLLAKMHEEGVALPKDLPSAGGARFQIYAQILDWVCKRQEDKRIPASSSVRLRRFLQVAGLATHQSGQRALHWRHFAKALEQAGLVEDSSDVDAKVHSTILSFAFTSLEERAWEFTHKSFGEALAAEAVGRVLEDISEPGRDGEPWRVALPAAAKTWTETFGPHFLTKDVMDFCRGWLLTKGPEFSSNLMSRLIEVLNQLLGRPSADNIAAVSTQTERPIQVVLGNALRSWFALSNENLSILVNTGGEAVLEHWIDTIDMHQFRSGVYLSSLVSPISAGEAATLFRWPSALIKGKRRGRSSRYHAELLDLVRRIELTQAHIKRSGGAIPEAVLRLRHLSDYARWALTDSRSVDFIDHRFQREMHFTERDVFYYEERVAAPPMEAILTDLESTLAHGFEPNPTDEVLEHAGVEGTGQFEPTNADRILRAVSELLGHLGTRQGREYQRRLTRQFELLHQPDVITLADANSDSA